MGKGEKVGEISIMALFGVVGADMLFLGRIGRMQRLLIVGEAMVGRGWIFERMEVTLIASWDSRNF